MEKLIEELPLKAAPGQFWGAVKIYTEKPHVINRRICGAVDVWVGVTEDNICRETVMQHLEEVLGSESKVVLKKGGSCAKQVSSCNESELMSHEDIFMSTDLSNQFTELDEDLIENIMKVLCSEGFREVKQETIDLKSPVHEQGETEHHKQNEVSLSTCTDHNRKMKIPWQYLLEEKVTGISVIRKVIPKQLEKFIPAYEVVVMDRRRISVTYLNQNMPAALPLGPRLNYSFTLTHTGVALSCFTGREEVKVEDNPSVVWVQKKVLPKMVKWAAEVMEDGRVDDKGSLRLISVQEYNQLYQKLKAKYGKQLVKIWPESTDPLKFVYEDISIATYLILLWQQERAEKGMTEYQSFVDLGCGNGLLVYILSGEGHNGLGIDIKKRKIWDMFSPHVHLKEGIVEPSDKNLFPEYDWLIGNHSDELTPWLPVIAAKSSYTTRFFVIPCCAHDFTCKFRRRHAGRSQYSDYLEYMRELGTVCGFEVWQDKLRIPSTKRICFIGQNRTYGKENLHKIFEEIDIFVKKREKANSMTSEQQEANNKLEEVENADKRPCVKNLWSDNFRARDAVQQVRNCTQLEKSVREDLISTVANMLMEKKHIIQVEVEENMYVEWDRGGSMSLGDIAKGLDNHQLQALKKECGGLQTLLKNHKHMFCLQNGKVSLQSPVPAWRATVPSERIKTKHCWFHVHHRKGCPLPSDLCIFAHGDIELRQTIPSW